MSARMISGSFGAARFSTQFTPPRQQERSRLEQLGMKIDEWHRIEKSQIWNGSQVSFQKKSEPLIMTLDD